MHYDNKYTYASWLNCNQQQKVLNEHFKRQYFLKVLRSYAFSLSFFLPTVCVLTKRKNNIENIYINTFQWPWSWIFSWIISTIYNFIMKKCELVLGREFPLSCFKIYFCWYAHLNDLNRKKISLVLLKHDIVLKMLIVNPRS